jgi:hypothetical protein
VSESVVWKRFNRWQLKLTPEEAKEFWADVEWLMSLSAEQQLFTYEPLTSIEEVRAAIRACEGKHVQQVAYSSFMGTLTQICFTCRRIRSTVGWSGARSWSLEKK